MSLTKSYKEQRTMFVSTSLIYSTEVGEKPTVVGTTGIMLFEYNRLLGTYHSWQYVNNMPIQNVFEKAKDKLLWNSSLISQKRFDDSSVKACKISLCSVSSPKDIRQYSHKELLTDTLSKSKLHIKTECQVVVEPLWYVSCVNNYGNREVYCEPLNGVDQIKYFSSKSASWKVADRIGGVSSILYMNSVHDARVSSL